MDFGVTANYWRCATFIMENGASEAKVAVELYLNEETRRAGKKPVIGADFTFPCTLEEFVGKNPIELAYTKLKALDGFGSATDV